MTRLVGADLAKQHDEWTEGRRYSSLDVLSRSRIRLTATAPTSQTPTDPSDRVRRWRTRPHEHPLRPARPRLACPDERAVVNAVPRTTGTEIGGLRPTCGPRPRHLPAVPRARTRDGQLRSG